MKLSIIALACMSVAAFGCANATTQAKLDAANAQNKSLTDRLELAEGRVQEVRSESAHDRDLCLSAMAKVHQAKDAVVDLYNKEEPKVEQGVVDAYNAAKPVVVQKANEAIDYLKKEAKEHSINIK